MTISVTDDTILIQTPDDDADYASLLVERTFVWEEPVELELVHLDAEGDKTKLSVVLTLEETFSLAEKLEQFAKWAARDPRRPSIIDF